MLKIIAWDGIPTDCNLALVGTNDAVFVGDVDASLTSSIDCFISYT